MSRGHFFLFWKFDHFISRFFFELCQLWKRTQMYFELSIVSTKIWLLYILWEPFDAQILWEVLQNYSDFPKLAGFFRLNFSGKKLYIRFWVKISPEILKMKDEIWIDLKTIYPPRTLDVLRGGRVKFVVFKRPWIFYVRC